MVLPLVSDAWKNRFFYKRCADSSSAAQRLRTALARTGAQMSHR
jgi:hypothetical protein